MSDPSQTPPPADSPGVIPLPAPERLLLVALWPMHPWAHRAPGERPTMFHLSGLTARCGRIADDLAAALAPRDLLVGRAGAVLALLGRHRPVDVDDRAFVAGWLARRDDLHRVELAGPLDADALDAHRLQVHAEPPQLALCVDFATLISLTDRERAGAMPMLGAHLRLLVSAGVLDDTAAASGRTGTDLLLAARLERAATQAAMALQHARLLRERSLQAPFAGNEGGAAA